VYYHVVRTKRKVIMLKAKTPLAWIVAVAFICFGVLRAQEKSLPAPPSDNEYHICTGDVIQVSIYQHPELSRAVVANHDGNITLPAIRAVKAVGLSPVALASSIRDKLQSVVPDAQVTVVVRVHTGPPIPLRHEQWPRDITPPVHKACCDS
jgi:hypothetical protein